MVSRCIVMREGNNKGSRSIGTGEDNSMGSRWGARRTMAWGVEV